MIPSSRQGWRALVLVAGVLLQTGCYQSSDRAEVAEQVPLLDVNPDPSIVEVWLVAEPATVEILAGRPSAVWAYRDGAREGATATIPGPRLEANLGDLVIVHLRNRLPEATTIHWHGIRLESSYDGTTSTQSPIPPGGEFEYRFVVRDAGYFWFHPHVRADEQIERGLYAPLVVRAPDEPIVDRERFLVLDDIKLEADGALDESPSRLDLMLGRVGNVLLLDGRPDRVLEARAGTVERWRIVNVANGRFFQLQIPGHSFRVIGWDGGLVSTPYETERLLIAPGERYDVLLAIGRAAGADLPVLNVHYDRGHEIPDPGPQTVFTVRVGDGNGAQSAMPATAGRVAPIVHDETTAARTFVLSEIMAPGRDPEFFINGARWPDVEPVHVPFGATEIWEVRNDAEMDHPFHLHGMSFQILDEGRSPMEPLAWKDTVIVPRQQTIRFVVTYDAMGEWMFHCHILEHAERGMMGHLSVGMDASGDGGGSHPH